MAHDVYTCYAVSVNGTLIDGITGHSLSLGVQKHIGFDDGSPYPRFGAVMSEKPTATFTTRALATALGAVGLTGAAISSNVVFFFQKTTEGGIRAGATSHFKVTVAAGIVVPVSIRASQDGPAEMTYQVYGISSDGTTHPFAYADSQSLSGSPDSAEAFTVGPVSINGALIQPQSIEVDFGADVRFNSHSGYPYPTRVHIDRIAPSARVVTQDAGDLDTYGPGPVAQGATDSVISFWQLSENGTRVSSASASHVTLTMDDGLVECEEGSAQDGGDATFTVMLTPTYDGTTNAVLVISTGAALPT